MSSAKMASILSRGRWVKRGLITAWVTRWCCSRRESLRTNLSGERILIPLQLWSRDWRDAVWRRPASVCDRTVLSKLYRQRLFRWLVHVQFHYIDVIMTTMASQITSHTVVYSTVYSDTDQRKHQSSASLAFVWWIHRDRWIPRTNGQLRGKCFHLMTSSCSRTNSITVHDVYASYGFKCPFLVTKTFVIVSWGFDKMLQSAWFTCGWPANGELNG